MKWEELLRVVTDEPVFSSAILLAGDLSPNDLRRQLSRWVRAGRIIRLRRGLYTLAPPYRKVTPHPFPAANALRRGSYVSLQSALAYHGLIPEHAPAVTSITTGRPEVLETDLGTFIFRHVRKSWFGGYRKVEVFPGQEAFLAGPEKSLLDLIYLTPGADDPDYLRELRLQGLDRLNLETLQTIARTGGRPKLLRAAEVIERLAGEEEYREP